MKALAGRGGYGDRPDLLHDLDFWLALQESPAWGALKCLQMA